MALEYQSSIIHLAKNTQRVMTIGAKQLIKAKEGAMILSRGLAEIPRHSVSEHLTTPNAFVGFIRQWQVS